MEKPKIFSLSFWITPFSIGFAVSLAYPLIFALADNYGMCGGCGTVTIRPEMIGFMIGAFGLALFRGEFVPETFQPLSPLLLGFATGMVLPEFFGCPWCMFMQLGYGKIERLPEILGFLGGIAWGSHLIRRGIDLQSGPVISLEKSGAAGALKLLVAGVILCTLGWMYIHIGISGRIEQLSMAGVVAIGIALGCAMQRIRFCVVEGLRNMFLLRRISGSLAVLAMIGGSFLYALATDTLDVVLFDVSSWEKVLKIGMIFCSSAVAGVSFTISGGCTVWHAVNTGNGKMHSLVFLGGMLLASMLHKSLFFLKITRDFQHSLFFWIPRMNAFHRWTGAHALYLLIGGAALFFVLWSNRHTLFSGEDSE